jgi:hypothetical protein
MIRTCLGDQKWPPFRAWGEDAMEPRERWRTTSSSRSTSPCVCGGNAYVGSRLSTRRSTGLPMKDSARNAAGWRPDFTNIDAGRLQGGGHTPLSFVSEWDGRHPSFIKNGDRTC